MHPTVIFSVLKHLVEFQRSKLQVFKFANVIGNDLQLFRDILSDFKASFRIESSPDFAVCYIVTKCTSLYRRWSGFKRCFFCCSFTTQFSHRKVNKSARDAVWPFAEYPPSNTVLMALNDAIRADSGRRAQPERADFAIRTNRTFRRDMLCKTKNGVSAKPAHLYFIICRGRFAHSAAHSDG